MTWQPSSPGEEVREILADLKCPFCPNPIAQEPYQLVMTDDVIKAMVEKIPGTRVLESPQGEKLVIVHAQCVENMRLIYGPPLGETR